MEKGLGSEMNIKTSDRIDFFPEANITGGSNLDAKIEPCGAGIPVINVVPLKE